MKPLFDLCIVPRVTLTYQQGLSQQGLSTMYRPEDPLTEY